MHKRIAVPALLALLALGGGCDLGTTRSLVVRNQGYFDAEVTLHHTYGVYDEAEEETTTESTWSTSDLAPGESLRRELRSMVSVYVEVRRKGDGHLLLSETFFPEDFKGPEDELEIVVRP
jgi:hypothetical protein